MSYCKTHVLCVLRKYFIIFSLNLNNIEMYLTKVWSIWFMCQHFTALVQHNIMQFHPKICSMATTMQTCYELKTWILVKNLKKLSTTHIKFSCT